MSPVGDADDLEVTPEGDALHHAVAALAQVINLPDRHRALRLAMSRHPANASTGKTDPEGS